MPTLILSPRHTPDSQVLWRAAIQTGWDVERLSSWSIPDWLRRVNEPVLYVEALMAPMWAKAFGLTLLEPPDCWLPKLPDDYRKRAIRLSTLGAERANAEPAFIKPPNDKSFPARAYLGSELPAEFDGAMPVLVSEIVAWEAEIRCFVLQRQVRTLSVYSRAGELQKENNFEMSGEEERDARLFAEKVLGDPRIEFPDAVVIDVGIIRNRGWAVVELNAAWGSGLYGCDPVEVLSVLRHTMVPVSTPRAAQSAPRARANSQ